MKVYVSRAFAQLLDKALITFGFNVATGLTGSTDFPTPPVTGAKLKTDVQTFADAVGKADKGSVADTVAKNEVRDVVIDDLYQDAAYVEQNCGGSTDKIIASGFAPMTHQRGPQAIMPQAEIATIINENPCQLLVRVKPIANAHSYEAQILLPDGTWKTVATSSSARRLVIPDLVSGTTYTIRVRAIGAGNTYGAWSDSRPHVCT